VKDYLFSKYASDLRASEIREILKLTQNKDIISLAGGLPLDDLFPINDFKSCIYNILDNDEKIKKSLQYGLSKGSPDLINQLLMLEQNDNIEQQKDFFSVENVIVVSGSQQGIDMLCKLFIEPGDGIAVGLPSYLGAIQCLSLYGANFIGIPIDSDGIRVDILEDFVKKNNIKFIYTVPDFQNPTGVTLKVERRIALTELAEKYGFFIVEDSPYKRLRYEGLDLPSIYELDRYKNTISLRSLSKVFVPGLRLGWILAPDYIINKLELIKQPTDLCTSSFTQAIAFEYLKSGNLNLHISSLVKVYKDKRDCMAENIRTYITEENAKWNVPEGGMFFWLELKDINVNDLMEPSIQAKVAYVPGQSFYINNDSKNTIRLNFSYPSNEEIKEGIIRLLKAINEYNKWHHR
jgi:2-aminoadipate transaminase